ncbi:MAG: hypothetical protein ACR2HH_15865 [Chthoniobacterales bacterium]
MNETGRAPLFQIVDWNSKYENDRSRAVDNCRFVCVQNDLSDPALLELFDHVLGVYCDSIFLRMLRLCSRQKRPREGWLTHNGKRDGVPYSVDRLARVFRVHPVLVKVTIHACMASEVGWIACVGDSPDWLSNGTALLVEALATLGREIVTDLPPSPSRPDGDELQAASDDSLLSLTNSTISANAVALLPPASRQGHIEQKGTEQKRIEEEGNSLPRAASEIESAERSHNSAKLGRSSDAIETGEEARLLFSGLCEAAFGYRYKPSAWDNHLEHQLVEALPMQREDFDLLDWAYRLNQAEPDHAIFVTTPGRIGLTLRQSFSALIENLPGEVQKIRRARKTIGLKELGDSGSKTREEPDGWLALYQREYPNAELWPDSFWGLTKAVRDELPALRDKFKQATVGAAAE